MKKITLAIPFYNTSQYFLEAVEYALSDDFHIIENTVSIFVYHMHSSFLMSNIKVQLHAY